jgi:hypothetical protein
MAAMYTDLFDRHPQVDLRRRIRGGEDGGERNISGQSGEGAGVVFRLVNPAVRRKGEFILSLSLCGCILFSDYYKYLSTRVYALPCDRSGQSLST